MSCPHTRLRSAVRPQLGPQVVTLFQTFPFRLSNLPGLTNTLIHSINTEELKRNTETGVSVHVNAWELPYRWNMLQILSHHETTLQSSYTLSSPEVWQSQTHLIILYLILSCMWPGGIHVDETQNILVQNLGRRDRSWQVHPRRLVPLLRGPGLHLWASFCQQMQEGIMMHGKSTLLCMATCISCRPATFEILSTSSTRASQGRNFQKESAYT